MTRVAKLNTVAILLTLSAPLLIWWSLKEVLFCGEFMGMSGIEIIKYSCRFRLIQPEWLDASGHDLLFVWTKVELLTRLVLICGGWLVGMLVLNWRVRREMGSSRMPDTDGTRGDDNSHWKQ